MIAAQCTRRTARPPSLTALTASVALSAALACSAAPGRQRDADRPPPPPGAAVSSAESPTAAPADSSGRGWALDHLTLEVRLCPESLRIEVAGTLRLRAPAEASLGPDLVLGPGLAFDSVSAAGATVRLGAARDTARLRFAGARGTGSEVAVRVALRTTEPRSGRSLAVQPDAALASWGANWYPWPLPAAGGTADLLATGRVRIVAPTEWRARSNGRLLDSAVVGGPRGVRRAETWESPRALAWSFIAAPYVVSRQRVDSVDVAIYLMPRQAPRAAVYARAIPPMVRILSRAYGPYPFGTFGLAAVPASVAPPFFSGRSEQGYFLAHEHGLDGDSVNVPLFAHELAHMWWANLVDSRPPGDDMMDEGLASQGAALVVEAREGRAAARALLRDGAALWSARGFFHLWRIGADERLMNDYTPLAARAKGQWVYEMLRDQVGDSLYFATLRALLRERAGGSASLQDLRDAFLRRRRPRRNSSASSPTGWTAPAPRCST